MHICRFDAKEMRLGNRKGTMLDFIIANERLFSQEFVSTFLKKFSAEKDARVMKKIREFQAMYPVHSDGLTEEKLARIALLTQNAAQSDHTKWVDLHSQIEALNLLAARGGAAGSGGEMKKHRDSV